jgi:hypothetical protein
MTKELREKLARLRAVAPELNAATDEVAKVIQAVEKFLDGLNLGVSSQSSHFDEAPLLEPDHDPDEDDRPIVFSYLAYGRVSGRYQFYILKTTERRDRENCWEVIAEEKTPWTSAPREVKLASFERLPVLLEKIADRTAGMVEQASTTSKLVREVLDAIGDESSSPPPRSESGTPTLDAVRAEAAEGNIALAFAEVTLRRVNERRKRQGQPPLHPPETLGRTRQLSEPEEGE